VKAVIKQVVDGLVYLHRQGIIHVSELGLSPWSSSRAEAECDEKDTMRRLDCLMTRTHIQRDIKAGNLLLDADGTVIIADFGIAILTGSGDDFLSAGTHPRTSLQGIFTENSTKHEHETEGSVEADERRRRMSKSTNEGQSRGFVGTVSFSFFAIA
jgi:serine/threonine protein kinase